MQATVMLAISELSARAAKRTVPIHIAVAANPNAELLRTRYGRSVNCVMRKIGGGIVGSVGVGKGGSAPPLLLPTIS